MPKTFVVNVVGHVIVSADEEQDAIDTVRENIANLNLGPGRSGFRVESAVELVLPSKK